MFDPKSYFYYWFVNHLYLLSFPTRRSSDLFVAHEHMVHTPLMQKLMYWVAIRFRPLILRRFPAGETPRSEEHTSELQSQSNLVCRLLLEKKKIYIILSSLNGTFLAYQHSG